MNLVIIVSGIVIIGVLVYAHHRHMTALAELKAMIASIRAKL